MRLLAALLLLPALVLTGCGIGVQDEPTRLPVSPLTTAPQPRLDAGPLTAKVFFVRAGRLHPVERPVSARSVATALDLLVTGPTRSEVASGVRTAVAPQALMASTRDTSTDTVVIAVTPDFTTVTGRNQLLAVAQLVWTVTDVPGISQLRVTVDGHPVEVPTDDGLSGLPVDREDYMSVAPVPPDDTSTQTPTQTPTPTSESTGPTKPATPTER